MKPVKADFELFVTFSQNIPDKSINPKIDDAYKFTILPRLGTLAIDILNLDAPDYDPLDYDPDDYAGTRPELVRFYNDFIQHWWILLSMRRFLQTHGFNLSQYGYTKTRDPQGTFDQLTPQERVILGKQFDSDAEALYDLILANNVWTFDGTAYRKPGGDSCSTKRGNNFGLSAIS